MPSETLTAGDDWTVPTGVYSLTITLEGTKGADDGFYKRPGDGGLVEGEIGVEPGETYHVRSSPGGTGESDALNGGDSIDIRFGGTTLSDRIAVAAGGGGTGQSGFEEVGSAGGDGGADIGEDGDSSVGEEGGTGGTQTSGGVGGEGSSYAEDGSDGSFGSGGAGSGGGGAGWYGGGGGGLSQGIGGAGGGGGSNYVGGFDTVYENERGGSFRELDEGGLATIEYEVTSVGYLSVSAESNTSLKLNWSPPDGFDPDTYYVDRSTYDGGYSQIASTGSTSYTDSGLPEGAQYHYRIRVDGIEPSNTNSATTTLPGPSIDEVTLE